MTEYINVDNIITNILDNISIDLSKSPDFENIFEMEKTIIKIVNHINIIIKLYTNNFIYDNNIFNSLKNIRMSNYKHSYLLYYKKIRKTLGYIIFDIYRYSSYNVLLSNIPTFAAPILSVDEQNNLVLVNSEVILDTVEYYIGLDTVDNIFQVSECSYLVKIKDFDNCTKLCDLINQMQINNNIIKVEYLDPIQIVFEDTPLEQDNLTIFNIIDKSLLELGLEILYYLYNMISSVFKFTTGQYKPVEFARTGLHN